MIGADQGYQRPQLGGLGACPDVLGPGDRQTPTPYTQGFPVLPKRWSVERTFAWQGRYRRLSKDYEGLPATSEAWIHLTIIDCMLHRLTAA